MHHQQNQSKTSLLPIFDVNRPNSDGPCVKKTLRIVITRTTKYACVYEKKGRKFVTTAV